MWLMTPCGFFSIVQKQDDKNQGTLTIRARVRSDLENLQTRFLPALGPITESFDTDYRYRAKVPRGDLAVAMANIVMDLNYSNFKNEVAKQQGSQRAELYHGVWDVLYKLQQSKHAPNAPKVSPSKPTLKSSTNSKGLAVAWGGLLIDVDGRVLLREPANHFDGYVWTFPKGRPDPGETPEQAALREVKEETGYSAEITGMLPGEFKGGTTVNRYFLMKPAGQQGKPDSETWSTRWATMEEARELIGKTTNTKGRARDLAVLDALSLGPKSSVE